MDSVSSWFESLGGAANELADKLAGYLPSLLGALFLLLAGWLIARAVRAFTTEAGDAVNRLLDRTMPSGALARVRLSSRGLRLVGNVAFWLVVLLFVTAATRVARLDAFSTWLDRVIAFLPTLVVGALIVLAGYLVSTLVRDLVAATLASAGVAQSRLAGRAAQGATLLAAIVIGIDQVGIDVTFLVTLIAIALGALLAGVSLAFGLGARELVSNLLGAHYLLQQVEPGQSARIGDYEGEILEITPTTVVIAVAEGRVSIPARCFHERPLVLLTPEEEVRTDAD